MLTKPILSKIGRLSRVFERRGLLERKREMAIMGVESNME